MVINLYGCMNIRPLVIYMGWRCIYGKNIGKRKYPLRKKNKKEPKISEDRYEIKHFAMWWKAIQLACAALGIMFLNSS